ncbi:MAG: ABC transporter permease [Dorea sp.]
MKKYLLVMRAEIQKQQQYDYHSAYVYLSLLVWPILGFFEVYYTYRPFEMTGFMGISNSRELLAFLGTGFMAYTCFWSMVQGAWSMANQERMGGTLEISFLTPANRLAMNYGKALGALIQEVWMFCCFCVFILIYTGTLKLQNIFLLPLIFFLLIISSTIWGGMLNAIFLFSRDASIVMNLLDTPMTLFSGSRIPVSCFPWWAKLISCVFPLTYCLNIIRFVFHIREEGKDWVADLAGLMLCLCIMIAFTVFLIRKAEEHNRETGELQFY